jgi:hypothetical protein
MELRPLGFGEIFDRAVTIYIRNFVPFAAIVMVLVLPTSILQYVMDRGSQPELNAIFQIFRHPGQARTEHIPTIFDSPAMIVVLVVSMLLSYFIWPFALNAVAVGVARLYGDRPIGFRACYEAVLRRWPQITGLILVDFLVLLAWYVAAIVLILAIVFVVAALGRLSTSAPFAFWFGFGTAIAVLLVTFIMLAPLFVSLTFSMYSVVIEDRGVISSLVLGFQRVFNRNEFWRALLFAVAAGATLAGGYTMFGAIGLAAAFAHLPGLEATIEGLARAAITPFGVVLMAIYYFDVRIRHEAFDLEASLERLSGAPAA